MCCMPSVLISPLATDVLCLAYGCVVWTFSFFLSLSQVSPPKGNYVLCKRMGNTLFTAGHLPLPADGSGPILGKVGSDLTTDDGYEAARHVAINMIATIKNECGDLDKVELVKVR